MGRYKLVDFFARDAVHYKTAREALEHARSILIENKKPKIRKRSRLRSVIREIAPDFLKFEQYDHRAIANRAGALIGRPVSVNQVRGTLQRLKQRGEIRLTTKERSYKKLRVATSRDIAKHIHEVERVLVRASPLERRFMHGGWRGIISEGEARSCGLIGLLMAVEKDDPTKGEFGKYARRIVASKIGDAVRSELRRRKREIRFGQMDVFPGVVESEEDSVYSQPDKLEDLELLLRHPKARPHHVGVYAFSLTHGGPRRLVQLARVTDDAVYQVLAYARKYIADMKEKQKSGATGIFAQSEKSK